jgi:hypothetical protein
VECPGSVPAASGDKGGSKVYRVMSNHLAEAIDCDDGDRAAKILQDALGIESDDVMNYCFPKHWTPIASSAPASSANGCRPRRVS